MLTQVHLVHRWLPSECNVADGPSRSGQVGYSTYQVGCLVLDAAEDSTCGHRGANASPTRAGLSDEGQLVGSEAATACKCTGDRSGSQETATTTRTANKYHEAGSFKHLSEHSADLPTLCPRVAACYGVANAERLRDAARPCDGSAVLDLGGRRAEASQGAKVTSRSSLSCASYAVQGLHELPSHGACLEGLGQDGPPGKSQAPALDLCCGHCSSTVPAALLGSCSGVAGHDRHISSPLRMSSHGALA
eukprot:1468464-Amphidinium_carterae.1